MNRLKDISIWDELATSYFTLVRSLGKSVFSKVSLIIVEIVLDGAPKWKRFRDKKAQVMKSKYRFYRSEQHCLMHGTQWQKVKVPWKDLLLMKI